MSDGHLISGAFGYNEIKSWRRRPSVKFGHGEGKSQGLAVMCWLVTPVAAATYYQLVARRWRQLSIQFSVSSVNKEGGLFASNPTHSNFCIQPLRPRDSVVRFCCTWQYNLVQLSDIYKYCSVDDKLIQIRSIKELRHVTKEYVANQQHGRPLSSEIHDILKPSSAPCDLQFSRIL